MYSITATKKQDSNRCYFNTGTSRCGAYVCSHISWSRVPGRELIGRNHRLRRPEACLETAVVVLVCSMVLIHSSLCLSITLVLWLRTSVSAVLLMSFQTNGGRAGDMVLGLSLSARINLGPGELQHPQVEHTGLDINHLNPHYPTPRHNHATILKI